MASGIFAVLDDIAALMDDVAIASKLATKKTAAILGDDLAVNAEKATGFLASREIPVLWAITKGSFINKLIIVPIAILLSIYFPIGVTIVLLSGGCYLAYEGVEKVIHYFFHKPVKGEDVVKVGESNSTEDIELEKSKVKSAIMTDFILSVEIIIIALGTVMEQSLMIKILTVSVVSILATVGVYGLVAVIVRMDDAGYRLIKSSENKGFRFKLGQSLVNALPVVIKSLSIIGTLALLMVSGGIFAHNIDYFHHLLPGIPAVVKEFLIGIVMGCFVFLVVTLAKKVLGLGKAN